MANFSLQIKGLDELLRDARRAGGEMPVLMLKTMIKNTTKIQEDAKRIGQGRFKNQTGNLRRSIFRRATAARGVIATDEKYGAYVEEGTRPHIIKPKRSKMLAFKINGQQIFARAVHHPGSRPFPFMEPAFKENIEYVLNSYKELGLRIVQVLSGK